MIQFTLGCVLIALSLFFGAKEIMSNNDIVGNRTMELSREETRVERSKSLKEKFEGEKVNTISYSTELKNNLLNLLNVDERKYDFTLEENKEVDKAITVYKYSIQGYDGYGRVFSLLGDIEKINGLFIDKMCLDCKIDTKKGRRELTDISFKIEGNAYVYKEK